MSTSNFTEAVMGQLDAAFDYGRPNISLSAAAITGTPTGVQFALTQAGASKLPDALVVQFTIDAGTVTGQPTVAIEGTLDGTNWGAIVPAINSGFTSGGTLLVALSAHSGTGVPTHILGIRVRISSGGTGTGKLTATIAA